jgi:hypothetical protein
MAEEGIKEIMKGNLKLSVFDTFPYEELKKICDAICNLGYECKFAENGNVIFQRKSKGLPYNPANSFLFKAREQPNKEFIPTPEQEAKWSNEKATEKQVDKLKKMEYGGDTGKLSKLEAYKLIKQIKEEEGDPEAETFY